MTHRSKPISKLKIIYLIYKSNILRIEHAKRMFGSLTLNERLIYLVFFFVSPISLHFECRKFPCTRKRLTGSFVPKANTFFFSNTNSWIKKSTQVTFLSLVVLKIKLKQRKFGFMTVPKTFSKLIGLAWIIVLLETLASYVVWVVLACILNDEINRIFRTKIQTINGQTAVSRLGNLDSILKHREI